MMTKELLPADANGYSYKLEVLTDVTGSRWWVNCWNATTAYCSMGASDTRPMPPTAETIKLARSEAFASLKGVV